MSHFTVAVFTKEDQSIEELLAPFDEGLEVAPYVTNTKEQLIKQEKKRIEDYKDTYYAEYLANTKAYIKKHESNPDHIKYIQTEFPKKLTWSDEQIYRDAIKYYNEDEIDSDGGIISTYNPNSKWDWYSIGGRWSGYLIRKQGVENCHEYEADSCLASEIDFDAIKERLALSIEPFDDCFERKYYKPEYFDAMYPTEEAYIKAKTTFSTYAVVTPDGVWHSSGDMGWFGVSSETADEHTAWRDGYFDNFITPAIKNGWTLTLVDCHI